MYPNHHPMPQYNRDDAERVRNLWRTFEKWLAAPRKRMEVARFKALQAEDAKWHQTPAKMRCSEPEHKKNKVVIQRKLEEEHFIAAREEWQKRLAQSGLVDEAWVDINASERIAVENALGAHLDEQAAAPVENVVPPTPLPAQQPPAQTSAPAFSSTTRSVNSSASSYAMVNPSDLGKVDEDFFYKVVHNGMHSEDEDLGIPNRAGWGTESSGYTTTWSTDSAQSSKTGSPEQPPHRPLSFDPVAPSALHRGAPTIPALPKRPPDATTSKTRLPGPTYIGPVLTDPTDSLDDEASFEAFKMGVRNQMIVEFHREAARLDILLARENHTARKTLGTGKGEDLSMIRAHEQRMRELRMAKEEERKTIVATERKRRRDEIKRRSALRDPGRTANTTKAKVGMGKQMESAYDDTKLLADLENKFNLADLLAQVPAPQVKEPENPYASMQGASFAMFEKPFVPEQQPHPSMWRTPGAGGVQDRFATFQQPYASDDEEDEEEEEEEGEMPQEFMNVMMEAGGYGGSQWGMSLGEEPETKPAGTWGAKAETKSAPSGWGVKAEPKPVESLWGSKPDPKATAENPWGAKPDVKTPTASSWGLKSEVQPTPSPAPVASGWAKKPGAPLPAVASGWGKKPSLLSESSGRDTPSSQTKKALPSIASKWKLEPEVPEPSPTLPGPKSKPELAWSTTKKVPTPVVESRPPVAPKMEKVASSPAPPAALAGKKLNKKQRQALLKKGGASALAENADPELPMEESSPEPPEEDEEHEYEFPEPPHAKGKMEDFMSTPRPMTHNPFFDLSTSSPFKLDDGPSTPRPTPTQRLSNAQEPAFPFLKADQTIRQSGLRKQWLPTENFGATSSKATLDQPASRTNSGSEGSSPEFWTPDGAWGASDAEFKPPKVPVQPLRPSVHEIWVPGGTTGGAATTRQMWAPPPASRSPQVEKSTSMPEPRGYPATAQRLRRLSDPGSPSPRLVTRDLPNVPSTGWPDATPASILKKAKGKKNGKGKQVTIEEISDEEGDVDWTEKLPSDSRIIMEPKPSAPPAAFVNIFGYEAEEGQEEQEQDDIGAADGFDPEWFAAAARKLQQDNARMAKLHEGSDMGMLGSKSVHWTPSVIGGDSPSPQVFDGNDFALESLEEEDSFPIPGGFRRVQVNNVAQPAKGTPQPPKSVPQPPKAVPQPPKVVPQPPKSAFQPPKSVEKAVPPAPVVEPKPKAVPEKKSKKGNGKRK